MGSRGLTTPLTAFLQGKGPDARGRTIFDVLAFDDAALERTHDFIQWLFPLPERSGAQPDAPVLSQDDIALLRQSMTAQAVLAAATDRMAAFYRDTDAWLAASDHNHLRITRIIRSLRLLRGDDDADAFRAFVVARVQDADAPVNGLSLRYWETA